MAFQRPYGVGNHLGEIIGESKLEWFRYEIEYWEKSLRQMGFAEWLNEFLYVDQRQEIKAAEDQRIWFL